MGNAPVSVVDQFSDEQKNEIRRLYADGKTQQELANLYGVPRRTMMKLIVNLGLSKPPAEAQAGNKIEPEFIEKVGELRQSGKTIQEIAADLGSSIAAIGRVCKKNDFDKPDVITGDIKLEYESGMNCKQLADKYRTSSFTIRNRLIGLGIKLRDPLLPFNGRPQKRALPALPEFIDCAEWFDTAYVNFKCSMPQISEFTGLSVSQISGRLTKYGIKLRSISESVRTIDCDQVLKLYSELGTMSKVSERLQCTVQAIKDVLLKRGVVPATTSEIMSGDGNPFYGQQHDEATKAFCAEIGAFNGAKFWVDHPEYIDVVKEKQKLHWSDLSKRAEDSKRIAQLRKDGKCNSHKGVIDSRFGELKFDSSYELAFIEFCEKDQRVVALERDFSLVEYEWDGRAAYFVPDFRLWLQNGEFLIVEVKSDWLAKQSKEIEKIRSGFGSFVDKFMVVQKDFDEVAQRVDLLMAPLEFEFDDIELKEIGPDLYVPFYGLFHYVGKTGRRGHTLGAFLNDKLIACATISSITRNEIAEKQGMTPATVRELVRFCIHPDFHKPNFGSWFLARAVKEYIGLNQDIKMLVSFADTTQGHTGSIYKAANWVYDGDTKSSYHYQDTNGGYIHKKTAYDRAINEGVSEGEYASSNKLFKVFEAPKLRFIYRV